MRDVHIFSKSRLANHTLDSQTDILPQTFSKVIIASSVPKPRRRQTKTVLIIVGNAKHCGAITVAKSMTSSLCARFLTKIRA
jgi:hypothetical protein